MYATVGRKFSHGDSNGDLLAEAKRKPILDLAIAHGAQLTPEAGRSEFSGPCLYCGGEDRLHVSVTKNGWFCRGCYPLEEKGWKDSVDFITYYDKVSVSDAVRTLTGRTFAGKSTAPKNITRAVSAIAPLSGVEATKLSETKKFDPEYYTDKLKRSQAILAGLDGAPGVAYLEGRGFKRATWERFGLGFDPAVPVPGTEGKQKAPAIVMPWWSGNVLKGVRYRFVEKQTNPLGKSYKQSGRGEFVGLLWGGAGLPGFHLVKLLPGERPTERLRTVIVCEGELNAMSIWQEAQAANVDVMSIGSQDTKFTPGMLAFLHRYGKVLVWMDEPDRAARVRGDIVAGASGLVAAIQSPEGKDANDLLQLGHLQFVIAYLRFKHLTGGDTEMVRGILCDYFDAAGEMELSPKTLKILNEYTTKVRE